MSVDFDSSGLKLVEARGREFYSVRRLLNLKILLDHTKVSFCYETALLVFEMFICFNLGIYAINALYRDGKKSSEPL
jgi:hypothetical protein